MLETENQLKQFELFTKLLADEYENVDEIPETLYSPALIEEAQKMPLPHFVVTNFTILQRSLSAEKFNNEIVEACADYTTFLKHAAAWETDPENVVKSYNWLQHHPIFWYKETPESTFWNTDDGLQSLSFHYNNGHKETNSDYCVLLEHGPKYSHPVRDVRLEVHAPNFDAGLVSLGANVNKFYDLLGADRPNVPFVHKIYTKKN